MAIDPLARARAYHEAFNAGDIAALTAIIAETAEYHSPGIKGVLPGRDNILKAIRAYRKEFPDQVNIEDKVEVIASHTVKSHWRFTATSRSSGRLVKRQGWEILTFNARGEVVSVDVHDVNLAD
ncbi:MAG TPA: nuclear transport factor 2 family protein [Aestuariivirga sp.]|nr:nuclear transport factor 2 family protein [Aestuariivirga sp.]